MAWVGLARQDILNRCELWTRLAGEMCISVFCTWDFLDGSAVVGDRQCYFLEFFV